jgi:predicted adenylyl cyclase CyaB
MREIELKAVVGDWEELRRRLRMAGAVPIFAGRLEDRRYDTTSRALVSRDEVLRLRVYRAGDYSRAELAWKGGTSCDRGYKVREEVIAPTGDPDGLAEILERLGFEVIRPIDREIEQYEVHGATVRLERYPRMDDLVEVEGSPDTIERAIEALGIARQAFTAERLPSFAARFEARTGAQAALCDGELRGIVRFRLEDA